MTSWVKAGAMCVCIDQEWHDMFSDEEVDGPMLGERYMVSDFSVVDGAVFVKLFGGACFFEAIAFRPTDDVDQSISASTFLPIDSYAPIRTLAPACSR